jgi:hypothetical protein
MLTLVVLFCQAFEVAAPPPEEWPSFSDMEWTPARKVGEERFSVEAFAVYTKFDSGIRLEDGWGFGADMKIGVNWGGPTLVVRLGYAGWSTENDDSKTFPGHTTIGQYRLGIGGDFAARHFEFGLYANMGLIHFHTRHVDNDTAPYFELEATAGYKPVPFLKVGLTGMLTWVNTNFNRASTHLWVNESIGPSVEVKIEF